MRAALILLSIIAIFFIVTLGGCGGGAPPPQPWNGPANIEELKIKGVKPDGAVAWGFVEVSPRPDNKDALVARGKDLFQQACAGCHGADAKGNGSVRAKYGVPTPPADLTDPKDTIKIRSTYDFPVGGGTPQDTDLFRTLTRGIPGTAMWSYRELPAEDRWALVAYIQSLDKSYELVSSTVQIPAKIPRDPGVMRLGETAYQGMCMTCHGRDGTGGSAAGVDPQTGRAYPGLAFASEGGANTLGGRSEEDLARTILTGFHRKSVMRSFRPIFYEKNNLSPTDREIADRKVWGTVYHVIDLMEAQKNKK